MNIRETRKVNDFTDSKKKDIPGRAKAKQSFLR